MPIGPAEVEQNLRCVISNLYTPKTVGPKAREAEYYRPRSDATNPPLYIRDLDQAEHDGSALSRSCSQIFILFAYIRHDR